MDEEGKSPNPLAGINLIGPDLDAGEVVVDAVLIVRLQSVDEPRSRITVYRSEGLDDVTETGMLAIHAHRALNYWNRLPMGSGDDD